MPNVKARPLTSVAVPHITPADAVIVLADDRHKNTGYRINPEGLEALLAGLLPLVGTWAENPDLKHETFLGPMNAIPAARIAIQRGRTNTECAVRIYLGRMGNVELAFIVPLDDVISAMKLIASQIDPTSGVKPN